jgi:hypothetical protein
MPVKKPKTSRKPKAAVVNGPQKPQFRKDKNGIF